MAKKPKGKQEEQQPSAPLTGAKMALPEGFKQKRQVTLPTLSLKATKDGVLPPPRFLKFEEAMHESKYVDPDPKKQKEKPATIAAVTDMESGEVYQFIVPSVVQSQLERNYPDNAYVGCIFRLACLGKRPGKRYWDFSITEVEQA